MVMASFASLLLRLAGVACVLPINEDSFDANLLHSPNLCDVTLPSFDYADYLRYFHTYPGG
jgi:hypothetical protein